jgi:beta-N-acetylhexosaminidase
MILGALPREGGEEALAAYAAAGLRAFLFPGSLLLEESHLTALVALARRLCDARGQGPVLAALGGWSSPSSSYPGPEILPSHLSLAATRDRRSARRTGFLLGSLAASCGIDLVFAPNLDLATDAKTPLGVLDRFGEEPALAGALGAAFAGGLERGGVAACAGRFPGCGNLVPDARPRPPLLPHTRERLEEVELPPFARVIRAGVAAVLVARAFVPALEEARVPAARSDLVVEGRLRGALGFRGLAIGDALDGALAPDPESPGRAALLGALAGCDLTICLGVDAALAAAGALDIAAATGDLPAPRLAVAARRLELLVAGHGRPAKGGPVQAAALLGSHARLVAERAATVLTSTPGAKKGRGAFVREPAGLFVLVFAASPSGEGFEEARASLAEELPGAHILYCPAEPGAAETEAVLARIAAEGSKAEALVLTSDAHLRPGQESLVHVVEEAFASVSVIALRDPYDAAFFPRARALGAVYGSSPACLRAAARMALGSLDARGSCPVAVLGIEV